jgi:hypothetical protein
MKPYDNLWQPNAAKSTPAGAKKMFWFPSAVRVSIFLQTNFDPSTELTWTITSL